jgi:hypothetical protein
MIKKRIFALTVMVCIIAMGVVYGKWTKRLNVGLETKSGVLKYEVGDISDCKVSIVNNDLRYNVPEEQIEFAEESKELVIKVSALKLKEISGDSGKITGININYAAKPSDKNTIYSIDVDKEPQTHIAEVFREINALQDNNENINKYMETASNGEAKNNLEDAVSGDEVKNMQKDAVPGHESKNEQEDVVSGEKLSELISSKIECITETSSEYKLDNEEKYLGISHNTKLKDYEYRVGDIITIEYNDVIEQQNKETFIKKTNISVTNCLWSQKLKLQCRILITE